jgi:hypothetical protein
LVELSQRSEPATSVTQNQNVKASLQTSIESTSYADDDLRAAKLMYSNEQIINSYAIANRQLKKDLMIRHQQVFQL